MSNQEQQGDGNSEDVASWLPIGIGLGTAIGAGLGAATAPEYLGIFIALGTAVGLVFVGAGALILRHRP